MTTFQSTSPRFQPLTNGPSSSQSLRILFLTPFAPHMQADHGGGRVIAQLITHLAQRHSVGLCYLRSIDEPAVDSLLRERCEIIEEVVIPKIEDSSIKQWSHRLRVWKELIAGRPLWAIDRSAPAYGERVKRLLQAWRPDIVQIEFHIMGQYLSALANYPAPRILVQHEPGEESAREMIRASFAPGRIVPQLDLLAWKRFEPNVIRQVQAVVVFTERDRQAVYKLGRKTPIVKIPLGAETPDYPMNHFEESSVNLLFVGNFKHLPNLDAADRLINKIFPLVQSQFPEARLFIVGDHLPSDILRAASKNVILTGYVPDVRPYLERAALVVVPLRLGGGMRVKVLEALAAGKAIVASSLAIEGLNLEDGRQVVLAESDQEFSRAAIELLSAPELRSSLAGRAHSWASTHLSWEKTVAAYEDLYQRLLRYNCPSRLTV